MEPNSIDFETFYTNFESCVQIQDKKPVNNRVLSKFLEEKPEQFFTFLLQILKTNGEIHYKRQAALIIGAILLKKERLGSLEVPFKIYLFNNLWAFFIEEAVEKVENFSIFEQIAHIFAELYCDFDDNRQFLPFELTNNLMKYHEIPQEKSLFKAVFSVFSKVFGYNNEHSDTNLIKMQDFIDFSPESSEEDIWTLTCYVNVYMKLFRQENLKTHHPLFLEKIISIFDFFMEKKEWVNHSNICEEMFGYYVNFVSEIENEEKEIKLPNATFLQKIFLLFEASTLPIRRVFSIFLSNYTRFPLQEEENTKIFECILRTFSDSLQDEDEKWLTDVSFEKHSTEQNIYSDYTSLAHFHYTCMILYTNVSDEECFKYLKKFSEKQGWRDICGLVTALRNLVSFTELQQFTPVFPYIFCSLNFPHAKVRLALLSLIEEMAIEYGNDLHTQTHQQYAAKIKEKIDDPVPRIQIMASFVIASYFSDVSVKIAKKLMEWIVPKLKKKITDKDFLMLPEYFSIASEFLQKIDKGAKIYAAEFLPLACNLKAEGLSQEHESNFYGKLMEFIWIFVQALGEKELLTPYKEQIVNILLQNLGKIKQEITLNDIYLLNAWQSLGLVFRKDIQNYLGVVIGKLIPLGIKYMKDREELKEINQAFHGEYPRIFSTELSRDLEILKNLGEILKIFLENAENEPLKNVDTIMLFLLTGYKALLQDHHEKKEEKAKKEEKGIKAFTGKEEENIFYKDLEYFYKDLVSCGFLFLQRLNPFSQKEAFLSAYRRITNNLWQIAEESILDEKPLIKLQYKIYEALKFAIFELPVEALSSHEVNNIISKVKKELEKVNEIDFDSFSEDDDDENEEEENEEENQEENNFSDFRCDILFAIHEIISNLIKKLSNDQKHVIIASLFNIFYLPHLENYSNLEELTEVEEDIHSAMLYSLVEILLEIPIETLHSLDWQKLLKNLIKYSTFPGILVRHNSAYSLGYFHEKLENHHDLFPEIINYVEQTITELEKATEIVALEEGNDDHLECLDNVYGAIGRVIKTYFGNNEFIKGELILKYLSYLPIKHDVDEGKDQHQMVVELLLKFWHEIAEKKEGIYQEILRVIGELCFAENKDLIELKTKKLIKKLIIVIKTNVGALKFEEDIKLLKEEKKEALIACLNDKDLDDD